VHDAETELKFILQTLASFRGEVVITGDVLMKKWREVETRALAV
jgi:hypothetical protein